MHQFRYFIVVLCFATLCLGACNRIPDHAKYIPKDAVVVVGVDLKALTKKVAWNAITGSKLYKEMQKKAQGKTGDKGFEDAGIDLMNTMYVYMKGDKTGNAERVTGLIPLADAAKLEVFIKGNFPGKAITQQGKIKTAQLDGGMYLGWNDHLLMVMNASGLMMHDNENYADSNMSGEPPHEETAMSEAQLAAEMQAAFEITPENSLINNDRYATLEHERHDVLFWMNYELLMNKYTGSGAAGMEWMSNLSAANTFWKNAALTAGFDFEKGKVTSVMHYYVSDELHNVCKELGGTNADKNMIDKLPAKNLDMLFAFHLSTKGTHEMLEKMGVLGFANLALGMQNMDADYILDAFTGDMALALNDFRIKMDAGDVDTSLGGMSPYRTTTRMVNFVYVLKINKKENFDKVLALGKDVIHPMGKDAYYFSYFFDSLYMVCNDKYAAISNRPENAAAYLQNSGSTVKGAETVYGHPFGFYMDFQQMAAAIDPAVANAALADSTMVAESRKLLQNLLLTGAEFKNNNFEYHMELNFMNKEENSLIQLMNLAMQINDGKAAGNTSYTKR